MVKQSLVFMYNTLNLLTKILVDVLEYLQKSVYTISTIALCVSVRHLKTVIYQMCAFSKVHILLATSRQTL